MPRTVGMITCSITLLMYLGGHHRRRGVSPHTTGVEAGITVANPLVILTGSHRQHVLAIDHDDEARLFTLQKLLDHHPGARVAKGIAGEHVAHRVFRLLQGHGDNHPLARRQTIGLDDDRGALLAQIGQRWLHLGEVLVLGGWDGVTGQEILGKGLGTFQLGSGSGRAKDGLTGCAEGIHHPFDQGGFRPDDGESDLLLFGKGQQPFDIGRLDGNVLDPRLKLGTCVARRYKNVAYQRGVLGLPGQGVFAATIANDQYFHRIARFYLWSPDGHPGRQSAEIVS